jgi:hypothetical protein
MNIKERLIDFVKNYCTSLSVPARAWEKFTLKDDVLTINFTSLFPFVRIKNGSNQLNVYLYIIAYALSFTCNVKIHVVSYDHDLIYDPINEFKNYSPTIHDLMERLMKELTAVFSVMNDVEGFNIFLSKVNKEAITSSINTLLQTAEDFGCFEIKAILMRYANNERNDISL